MDKNPHSEARRQVRDLLREIRQKAGLRQQEVADRVGEPQSLVSKVESGERRIDVIELREICTALGISLEHFVERLEARLPAKKRSSRRRT